MESCLRLFVLAFLILPTALQIAPEIVVPPTVTGYTGSDVVLPCSLRNTEEKVTLMQWDYVGKNISQTFLLYLPPSYVSIRDPALEGRISLKNSSEHDFSVVIREAVTADGGQYTCSLSLFPSGSIKGSTQLVVQAPRGAPEIVVPPTVTGYTGSDVVLPCTLRDPADRKPFHFQWNYVDKNISKLVYPPLRSDSPLGGRISLKNSSVHDFSVVIREAVTADGGQYTCYLRLFPSDLVKGSTQLVVQDQKPLSAGGMIRIVMAVAVTLSFAGLIVVAYVVIIRKGKQLSTT